MPLPVSQACKKIRCAALSAGVIAASALVFSMESAATAQLNTHWYW
jgi:hypothetical protein